MKTTLLSVLVAVAVSSVTTVTGLAIWTWLVFPSFKNATTSLPAKTVEIAAPPTTTTENVNPQITNLEASLAATLNRLDKLEVSLSSAASVSKKTSQAPAPAPKFDDQVIYLGTATTTSRDWASTGVEVTLNSASYPQNAKLTFEAGLSIIGGEAGARLKNKSTGAIIAASEVQAGGSTTSWKTSTAFTLFPGTTTYVVELRSTSGEVANLQGSRLIVSAK